MYESEKVYFLRSQYQVSWYCIFTERIHRATLGIRFNGDHRHDLVIVFLHRVIFYFDSDWPCYLLLPTAALFKIDDSYPEFGCSRARQK